MFHTFSLFLLSIPHILLYACFLHSFCDLFPLVFFYFSFFRFFSFLKIKKIINLNAVFCHSKHNHYLAVDILKTINCLFSVFFFQIYTKIVFSQKIMVGSCRNVSDFLSHFWNKLTQKKRTQNLFSFFVKNRKKYLKNNAHHAKSPKF